MKRNISSLLANYINIQEAQNEFNDLTIRQKIALYYNALYTSGIVYVENINTLDKMTLEDYLILSGKV